MNFDVDTQIRTMIKNSGYKTQKKLASWLGCTESYITKWKNQGYIPNDVLEKYESEFGKLIYQKKPLNIVTIKYYQDIRVSAGYGVENSELKVVPLDVTKDFLRSFFQLTNFNNLEIITVYGDSMLPFFHNGETILIQRTHEIRNNQIIIIRVENDVYVKRYIKEPFGDTIRLISENKDYPDINIAKEQFNDVQIIGVVCGSFRLR